MGGSLPQLGLVAALVVINALFAGSELALVSLREGQLQRLEVRSEAGRTLARLARDPNRFLATIQIGITLAGFLASASAAVSLAEPLEEPLAFLGGAAPAASIVLVTVALSYVTLVFGELAPKRLAMQRAEAWGLVVARPLGVVASLARPAVWALSRSTDAVVRLLGGDPDREREEVTEEEIRDLVAAQETFSDEHRTILTGAFDIADRRLHGVLRPRPDVFVLRAAQPCADALRDLAESGHSRAPVSESGSLDDVVGVVHLRDLLDDDPASTAGSVAAPVQVLAESARVLDALRTLQNIRAQLAVVVSEHGGAEGIVTVEDLVEELVGEIYDETDRDLLTVERRADGSMRLPGRFPAHDLADIGVLIPEGPYASIAGYLLHVLGRLPDEPGDTVEVGGWTVTVDEVDGRAITSCVLRPAPTVDVDPAEDPSGPDEPER